jgi:hypothetical protein
MTLNAYINNVTSKAQKLFGFLRRNLQIKSEQTKTTAYTSLKKKQRQYQMVEHSKGQLYEERS